MGAPTPLEPAPGGLVDREGVLLKREDVHELGAFKWRGALPALERLRDEGATTVVTASTGNHGAATAWAAERVGIRAVVFAPRDSTEAKLDLIRDLGAELRLAGDDLDAAKDEARASARESTQPFFEDGAHLAQFDGYEEIGAEIVAQLGHAPGAVLVPVGNGALFIGVGRALARLAPATERIAVVAKRAPVMALSIAAGHPVECELCDTVADGMAVRVAVPLAVREMGPLVSRTLLVSERAIAEAIAAYEAAGTTVEGAGAATLAALAQVGELHGEIVLLVTGRNLDPDLRRRALSDPSGFPE